MDRRAVALCGESARRGISLFVYFSQLIIDASNRVPLLRLTAYGGSPNTPTPFVVPTYTLPFAMVGVITKLCACCRVVASRTIPPDCGGRSRLTRTRKRRRVNRCHDGQFRDRTLGLQLEAARLGLTIGRIHQTKGKKSSWQ